ncbi:MAG: 23S rRNA (uracil(1939)-C(5))-methyltransferase RlmD [Ruminococcaceae bacterium]|nr:23S rRNA (uracil(1939)-C(5))-methyltransferase RlmD [Oscillospiraceae bacterium]
MSLDGCGIAKADGYTIFIKNAVIGDTVRVRVTKANRSYGFAVTEELITPSPDRISPTCAQFGQCGGCQLMHLSYPKQLEWKAATVRANLRKIGGIAEEDYQFDGIIGAEKKLGYRNKTQFPVGRHKGQAVCGFYLSRSHQIVPCTACGIATPAANQAVEAILSYINQNGISVYDEATHKGLVRHIYIRDGGKELMAVIVANSKKPLPHTEKLVEALSVLPQVKGIVQNVNTERTNVVLGKKNLLLWGNEQIVMQACGLEFMLSPNSFFQVNTAQMERLYARAAEYAQLSGTETVFDLYSGVGSISLYLAKKAGQVVGVEIVPDAVENARQNALRNGIENVQFHCGDCAEVVERLLADGIRANIVVVDPPRKGCDEALLSLIERIAPKRLVYVSCNSATLARDAAWLKEHGYTMQRCSAVDMFPNTTHVETVVLLQRQNT